jgi:outer membrane protein insertion porin family
MMVVKFTKSILLGLLIVVSISQLQAQEKREIIDYLSPADYILENVTISGIRFLDSNALIGISGLRIGTEISVPGEALTNAAKKLWDQGLFSDVRITISKIEGNKVTLDIYLAERPRLSSLKITGIKASESQDLTEKIALPNGSQVTAYVLNKTEKIIKDHFTEKGFMNTAVTFIQKDDPDQPNNVILSINIDKKKKVKVGAIKFIGNENFEARKLRKQLKGTKVKNINFFRSSKYIASKYIEDKDKLTTFYNDNGFKDFTILTDSVYRISDSRVGIVIKIDEGKQYFIRDIKWVGNSIYPTQLLDRALNMKKGSVLNQTMLDERLTVKEDAVNSLYLDNGYLFSRLTPVISKIEGDSIDLEIRIFEGDQAYINNVIIAGNTRTNEHVARRELYTLPGDLFSKEKIIRSQRQLGVLGHFDPEKISPQPIPDQINGTVDMLYKLEERANDQFEISGGWGAGMLVGSVGVRFNNFAMKNFFKLKEWKPYPSGDGQSLNFRVQTNGKIYQSYNVSFVEPWFGGKNLNNFSVSLTRALMTNGMKKGEDGRQAMTIDGLSIGLGKRLEWPDDYFNVFGAINYQRYNLVNYTQYSFLFANGSANELYLTGRLMRFSTAPNLIYPRSGSSFTLQVDITPPYSLISGRNYKNATDEVKYNWIEFHKWTFKADYYFPITKDDKMVLNTKFNFGYIGYYNKDIGPSPFENYYLGGDGMTGYSFYGRDVIGLRGYTNGSLTPYDPVHTTTPSGNVYSKMTFELRYPVSLSQQATIYGLAFLEAGKAWYSLKEYNPFKMNRSAGVGVRANLPMFGLLGIDWGYGFDAIPGNPSASKSQFHFVIGQQF